MINNTVSRTCVAVRSLDGGQHITDLSSVHVIIRPRSQVPFGTCEPCMQPVGWSRCGEPGSTDVSPDPSWLQYPAHEFNEDKTRICFHWDPLLWARPPGRYMATVYLCGVAIGCFQMQVGKRFVADAPTNVAFNPCEADIAICTPDVGTGVALPAVVAHTLGWAASIIAGTGGFSPLNALPSPGLSVLYAVNGILIDPPPTGAFFGGTIPALTPSDTATISTVWVPAVPGGVASLAPQISATGVITVEVLPTTPILGTLHISAQINGVPATTVMHITLQAVPSVGPLLYVGAVYNTTPTP